MRTNNTTATPTPDVTTYTQAELDSRLQAERISMANGVAIYALNPLHTLAKLLITGPELGDTWATPSNLGDLLELATMGAQLQIMRIAMEDAVGYSALPPYSYSVSDTLNSWERVQRQARVES